MTYPPYEKNRNLNDDFIRCISLILVIFIHADINKCVNSHFIYAMLTTVISIANCFFFLLSGKYNLRKEFNTPNDYLVFYKKKLIDILFPYVLISFMLSFWNLHMQSEYDYSVISYIRFALKEFFSINSGTHLWFMFVLLCYILSAPFLSKMLHAMSDAELLILLFIGLAWNFITIYLFDDFYHNFSYYGWILSGWIIYFVCGYCLDRLISSPHSQQFEKVLYISGIIGFLINVLGIWLFEYRFYSATDYAVSFVLFAFATYTCLGKHIKIGNKLLSSIIIFIAKHSFTIYMIHYHIIRYIVPQIISIEQPVISYFVYALVTFVLSLATAVILDTIINFPKRWLQYMLKV